MAVRTPLFWNGSNIEEMDATQINELKAMVLSQYSRDPSVDITVVSSGGSISPTMADTRLQAGATTTSPFDAGRGPGTTSTSDDFNFSIPGVSTVTVNYDRITQSIESLSLDAESVSPNFVYYNGSGGIRAFSNTDMFDTFYSPVIDQIVDGSDRAGTYKINTTTSTSGQTLVSSTPVFTDTRANIGAYTAPGETRDQPFTVNNYYVSRINATDSRPSQAPLYITGTNNLQQYNTSSTSMAGGHLYYKFHRDIRYYATQEIRYNINGSGNQRGSTIVDTKFNSSTRRNQNVGTMGQFATTYRSQQHPAGTSFAVNTFTLRIQRI